jgi:thioredoxin-related protein
MIKSKTTHVVLHGIFLVFCIVLYADNCGDALKRTQKENKRLVLFFFSKNRFYCNDMDKNVLFEKDISSSLQKMLSFLKENHYKNNALNKFFEP